jgi:hypothetical protein
VRRFGVFVGMELGLGVCAAGLVLAFALSPPVELSALSGLGLATVCGVWALFLKATVDASGPTEVKRLMTAQAVAFGLRLGAVVLGGLLMVRHDLDPTAHVLCFGALSMPYMFFELRYVLSARQRRTSVEVSR